MFVPGQYRTEDPWWHRHIVAHHPLATLVTGAAARAPYATRLPALLAAGERAHGPLPGATVVGHLNRANPHWRALADGVAARLMFDGPGAFVTPSCYPGGPAAPTWNFASVHLLGHVTLVTEPEDVLAIVRWTADSFEEQFGAGWDSASSVGYFRRILAGVGAFRLVVEAVEAMFKLSQEKSAAVQESVIERYEADLGGPSEPVAGLMRDYGLGLCPLPDPTRPDPTRPDPTGSDPVVKGSPT